MATALVSHCTACKAFYVRTPLGTVGTDRKCGRHFERQEHGRFRAAASTRKTSRLAAKKVGPVTEFPPLVEVHTREQARVVEAEEGASVVVIMVEV